MTRRRIQLAVSALALLAAALVAGCGGDGDSDPANEVVDGTGFTFTLPEDWTVTTDANGPAAGGSALDVQIVRNGNRGIQPTINVIDLKRNEPGAGSGGLREVAERNLADLKAHPAHAGLPAGTRVVPSDGAGSPDPLKIDGEPALRHSLVANFESERLLLEQIVVSHKGEARSISLITDSGTADSAADALDEVLASWHWRG